MLLHVIQILDSMISHRGRSGACMPTGSDGRVLHGGVSDSVAEQAQPSARSVPEMLAHARCRPRALAAARRVIAAKAWDAGQAGVGPPTFLPGGGRTRPATPELTISERFSKTAATWSDSGNLTHAEAPSCDAGRIGWLGLA